MSLRIVPVSQRDAFAFVTMWHRHLEPPPGDKASGTPEAPRNVTQLDTWRKALSDQAAAQRRVRHIRKAAQEYRGYRRTP